MTFKQWLVHVWSWILVFPLPKDTDHFWSRVIGDPEWECWVCGAKKIDDKFNDYEESESE
jgi:hypothetical protein